MIIHTYFDKNNTIVEDKDFNTANNPITELFFGGGEEGQFGIKPHTYSRFIFHFDETRLKELRTEGFLPDLSKLTHKIRMTNTIAFDASLLNDTSYNKERASSIELFVYKLDQEWDAGHGYDYGITNFMSEYRANDTVSSVPSNWFNATTLDTWSGGSGTYSGVCGTIINTQHFSIGNEDLYIDVTDVVNGILTGDTNYGFGIAYPREYEVGYSGAVKTINFFTNATQTFYEPFLETTNNEHIVDDRANFYKDKPNKLYLYVNLGNNPTDLDNIPAVDIYDNTDTLFSAFTGTQVTHVSKGVYSIDLIVPSSSYEDCVMFYDTWSNISINGITRPDIELDFVLADNGDYYNIGTEDFLPKKYGFSVHGVSRGEQIVRGDIRKILVSARIPYTINQTTTLDGLEYRLYIKEGPNEYTVMDYQPVEMAFTHNYFLLDTNSLIPNTYYLDVKLINNLSVETYKDVISFDIIGIVNERRDT